MNGKITNPREITVKIECEYTLGQWITLVDGLNGHVPNEFRGDIARDFIFEINHIVKQAEQILCPKQS